jgi:proteasome lid subunit RPN8/RPN11
VIAVGEDVIETILRHARSAPTLEVCGLLVGVREAETVTVLEARRARNVAAEGVHDRFTVDPRELLRIEEELEPAGLQLVGVYHSHPRSPPEPSLLDRRNAALWPSFVHAIAGTGKHQRFEVRWYWSDSGGVLSSAVLERPGTPSREDRLNTRSAP